MKASVVRAWPFFVSLMGIAGIIDPLISEFFDKLTVGAICLRAAKRGTRIRSRFLESGVFPKTI